MLYSGQKTLTDRSNRGSIIFHDLKSYRVITSHHNFTGYKPSPICRLSSLSIYSVCMECSESVTYILHLTFLRLKLPLYSLKFHIHRLFIATRAYHVTSLKGFTDSLKFKNMKD